MSIVICLALLLAGFPIASNVAEADCPMMAKMQETETTPHVMASVGKMMDCCKHMKQQPGQTGCCDDTACNAKCSALGASAYILPDTKPVHFRSVIKQYLSSWVDMPDSKLLNTQDRPPKYLS